MRGCRCALAEPLAAKRQRVAALLERLGLMACADTTIGDALSRGISGGQVPAALLSHIRARAVDWSSVCMDMARAKWVNEVCMCDCERENIRLRVWGGCGWRAMLGLFGCAAPWLPSRSASAWNLLPRNCSAPWSAATS